MLAKELAAELRNLGIASVPDVELNVDMGEVVADLVRPEPFFGHQLDASLLLRHALGDLYQEAHLEIERNPQLRLPGLTTGRQLRGHLPRDVRFTPLVLARSLARQAIDSLPPPLLEGGIIRVLDPACGSGVFLQEALRELVLRKFSGRVHLEGIDRSPISREMAEFNLARAQREFAQHLDIVTRVHSADALKVDWPDADLILMNPPFIAYHRMSKEDRATVKEVLGPVASGRSDLAMAFIWKAVTQLPDSGVLAAVLPATLFSNVAGQKWRAAILDTGYIRLIGRFRGYSFFPASMVEPGFFVITKRSPHAQAVHHLDVRILFAEEGAEEASLRALRLPFHSMRQQSRFQVYDMPYSMLVHHPWTPMPSSQTEAILSRVKSRVNTTVGDLFHVRQGAKTGRDAAFVISHEEYELLPEEERHYFRLAATNDTIRHGRISGETYLFYPYDESGPLINSERQLKSTLPAYYKSNLRHHKDALASRARMSIENWWLLTHERTWQRACLPKLVSKTFGRSGSFAFDDSGEYVVLQGSAWLCCGSGLSTVEFVDEVVWTYLALLNSFSFELLLNHYCPQVQGGQFYLSKKHTMNIPLPDLTDRSSVEDRDIRSLAVWGRAIHQDGLRIYPEMERLAALIYGIEWSLIAEKLQKPNG